MRTGSEPRSPPAWVSRDSQWPWGLAESSEEGLTGVSRVIWPPRRHRHNSAGVLGSGPDAASNLRGDLNKSACLYLQHPCPAESRNCSPERPSPTTNSGVTDNGGSTWNAIRNLLAVSSLLTETIQSAMLSVQEGQVNKRNSSLPQRPSKCHLLGKSPGRKGTA